MVIRQYFIKWWDDFKVERIIEQVQKEFLVSLFPTQTSTTGTAIPLSVKASEPKNKDKESSSKSNKSKSSPTTSIDIKSIKKCSSSEVQMLAKALNERIFEL